MMEVQVHLTRRGYRMAQIKNRVCDNCIYGNVEDDNAVVYCDLYRIGIFEAREAAICDDYKD